MQYDKFQINLDLLPQALQRELWDFYKQLLERHQKGRKQNPQRSAFFKSVEKHRFSLPEGYQFERELANER